jgi:hypothetical protein
MCTLMLKGKEHSMAIQAQNISAHAMRVFGDRHEQPSDVMCADRDNDPVATANVLCMLTSS